MCEMVHTVYSKSSQAYHRFSYPMQIKVSYSRFKHWFQFDYAHIKPKSHVVVAMFRDPYDWVEAMRERPHHAHEHIGLTWREFVTKPWVGPRRLHDELSLRNAGGLEEVIEEVGTGCIANFTWNEVVPCSVEDVNHDSAYIDGYARFMYGEFLIMSTGVVQYLNIIYQLRQN